LFVRDCTLEWSKWQAKKLSNVCMFTIIDKEEMQDCVEHGFATLRKKLRLEKGYKERGCKTPIET